MQLNGRASLVRVDAMDRVVGNLDTTAVVVMGTAAAALTMRVAAGDTLGRTLALAPDGASLLRSTALSAGLERWTRSAATDAPTRAQEWPDARPAADLSPDGARMVIARSSGASLRAATGGDETLIGAAAGAVSAVSFAPDGRSVLLVSSPSRSNDVSALSQWSLDGAALARTTSSIQIAHLRRAVSGDLWIAVGPTRDRFRGPNGVELLAANGALTVRHRVTLEGAGADSADLSASGATLLMAGWLGPMQQIRFPSNEQRAVEPRVVGARVAFAPRGDELLRAERDELRVTNAAHPGEGERMFAPCETLGCDGPAGNIVRLVYSADARVLAIGTDVGDLRLYCRAR